MAEAILPAPPQRRGGHRNRRHDHCDAAADGGPFARGQMEMMPRTGIFRRHKLNGYNLTASGDRGAVV